MAPATPPFMIHTCLASDGLAIGANNFPAFWANLNWRLMWTRANKDLSYVTIQGSIRYPHNLLKAPARRRHQKVVDANGLIVGYCRWILPEGCDQETWKEAVVPRVSEEQAETFKRESEASLWGGDHAMDVLDPPLEEMKQKWMKKKNYMYLDYLAVHPDHQRLGIASLLIESGLQEAQKMGSDVFVSAFANAKKVYDRAGFVLLESLVQDDSEWGGDGAHTTYFMEKIV